MSIALHQFLLSHFNEKARWALDFKGIAHRRDSYLPGPHIPLIKRLSDQQQTPVLDYHGEIVPGSAAIIDYLERVQPTPALYPRDPRLRDAALAIQRRWDRDVGPAVRTALFSILINEPQFMCQMFSSNKGLAKRLAYRTLFPVARGLIAKGNGVDDPKNVASAFETIETALDTVEQCTGANDQLIGTEFSVADLTAAALLAPLADVEHRDMALPAPRPPSVVDFLARFASHEATLWVRRVYGKYR